MSQTDNSNTKELRFSATAIGEFTMEHETWLHKKEGEGGRKKRKNPDFQSISCHHAGLSMLPPTSFHFISFHLYLYILIFYLSHVENCDKLSKTPA